MEQHLQSLLSIVVTQVIKSCASSDINILGVLEAWCVQNVNGVLGIATIWSLYGPGNEEQNNLNTLTLTYTIILPA